MIDLFEAARQLQEFCDRQGWRSCFIGGLAVQRWGEPRVTRDVDLVLLTGFGGEEAFIDALVAAYPARIDNAAEFARRLRVLLLKTPGEVGIDISLGALPFEERVVSRASAFSFGPGLEIRTCSAEDLMVLKLFASRPIDLRDTESVAIRQKGQLDWRYIEEQLQPLAELKDEPAILTALARLRRL
jgi:Nucleotidyl transferase AbiEii toxin, Type IV TA system